MLHIKQKLSSRKVIAVCTHCNQDFECNPYDARRSIIGHQCRSCNRILSRMDNPTQMKLLSVFNYNEKTGDLTSRLAVTGKPSGSVVGYQHGQGYLSVFLGGKEYLVHRIIWLMKTGYWPKQVDHKNHNRSDNRWTNLREVVSRDNQLNTGLKRNNSSGVNGVRLLPSGRYCAYVMINRKQLSLGSYDTLDEAKAARKAADVQYGFHANHGI